MSFISPNVDEIVMAAIQKENSIDATTLQMDEDMLSSQTSTISDILKLVPESKILQTAPGGANRFEFTIQCTHTSLLFEFISMVLNTII